MLTRIGNDVQVARLRWDGALAVTGTASADPMLSTLGPNAYRSRIALNLAGVISCFSSGVAWLLGCTRRCERAGGRLVLYAVPEAVAELIHHMRIGSLLHIASSEAEALRLLEGQKQ